MDAAAVRPWTHLLEDLLRHISGRLHDAADFVRFHAVCKTWRDTLPPPTSTQSLFLPWLLVPGAFNRPRPSIARFRSIFSKTTWCATGTSNHRNMWLASADGAGTWFLTSGGGSNAGDPSPPRLVNPFTGAAATLPPLPDEIRENMWYGSGVVCADGAVVLYSVVFSVKYTHYVVAAVCRPGDAAWTEAKSHRVLYTGLENACAASYHRGKVLLVDLYQSCVVELSVAGGGNEVLRTERLETIEHERRRCIYTLESRGELLAACVVTQDDGAQDTGVVAAGLSVRIYALETASVIGGKYGARWVRRDGRSMGDRVLFLGCPVSFTVDAARFGGAVSGGCAYFVFNSRRAGWRKDPAASRVYRYSFEDTSATVVEELPAGPGWEDDTTMMWFTPQLAGLRAANQVSAHSARIALDLELEGSK